MDDLPEAQRDAQLLPVQSGKRPYWWRWGGWFLVGLLSATAGLLVSWVTYQAPSPEPRPFKSAVSNPSPAATLPTQGSANVDSGEATLLGHRAYEEADPNNLVALSSAPNIKLHPVAAEQFEAMMAAARAEGIALVPLSGFRSVADQQYLFFDIKAQRGQTAQRRAEVSAPPGYSEHHTGYAIDIGDANYPNTHVQVAFENTPAFQWLDENAAQYSFELSFPKDNPQGIQYEPWHWRFVGDSHSLETFYQAR